MSNTSFWPAGVINLLRWLIFLPLTFASLSLLQSFPVNAVSWAGRDLPTITYSTLAICIIALICFDTIFRYYFKGVFFTTVVTCGFIAPDHKIAAVIFGTLFCLFQGYFLFGLFSADANWAYMGYIFIFSSIVIGSTVLVYRSDDL